MVFFFELIECIVLSILEDERPTKSLPISDTATTSCHQFPNSLFKKSCCTSTILTRLTLAISILARAYC